MPVPDVISYLRPIPPGSARITRRDGAVSITIAPDTARRTAYALTRPVVATALWMIVPWSMYENRSLPPVIAFVTATFIALIGGRHLYRIILRSTQHIILRADPAGLQVVNPLEHPADEFHAIDDLSLIQLRRTSLFTEPVLFQLELVRRAVGEERLDIRSILASPSFETLDKIGRTLCAALQLGEPKASGGLGWWCPNARVKDTPLTTSAHLDAPRMT